MSSKWDVVAAKAFFRRAPFTKFLITLRCDSWSVGTQRWLYAFNKGCSQTCSTFNHTEAEVDWNRVEGSWKQLKGKIKEQWGNLTDDDIEKIAGKREQLEGKIQERYGTSKDAVRKDVDEWLKKQ